MKRLQVYVTEETFQSLQEQASKMGISISTLVKLALANEKARSANHA